MFDNFFTFPIVVMDEKDVEKTKMMSNSYSDEPYPEMIIGEAFLPYENFLAAYDRWLPTNESLKLAKEEKIFEACIVHFYQIGSFLVPWNKDEFKRKLGKFARSLPKPKSEVIQVTPDQLKEIMKKSQENKTKDDTKE